MAEKVLDIDYDDGYGSQEIAADLVVAFTDGGFLRREEYDGSEWWEYEVDGQAGEAAPFPSMIVIMRTGERQ